MKRKIIILLLVFTLILLSIWGCNKSNDIDAYNDKISLGNEAKEITIIMSKLNTMNKNDRYTPTSTRNGQAEYDEIHSYSNLLIPAIQKFEEQTGISVKIEYTHAKTYAEYLTLRNTQLYLDNGPTLILISGGEDYQNLIKEGVALEIKNRIPNYNNIYGALKDGYYVPIFMASNLFILNKNRFEEMGLVEPHLDWDQSFFHHMMDAYYHDKRSYITREAVYVFINSLFEKGDLFVDERGNISIANKDMIEGIEKIRYEVMESGRFKREELLSLQNAQWSLQWFKEPFTYKDFKWLMESTYAEMQLDNDTLYPFIALDYDRGKNPWLAPFFTSNSMNSILTNTLKNDYIPTSGSDKVIHDGKIEYDEEKDIIFLPHPYPYYSSWGFIVNKNGKNIDAGLEFINMLLSDEVQLRQYKNAAREVVREHMNSRLLSFSTPVVNTIESELDSADKSENVLSHYTSMRKEILRQILEGERMRGYRGGSIRGAYPLNINLKLTEEQEFFFKEELEKVIVDVVFSDERYSSEKIMMELRKLENRLMLMFSE